MNWVEWLLMAFAAFVAILALSYIVLSILFWWWNKTFCKDK